MEGWRCGEAGTIYYVDRSGRELGTRVKRRVDINLDDNEVVGVARTTQAARSHSCKLGYVVQSSALASTKLSYREKCGLA